MLTLILLVYFVSFLDKPEKTAPQLSPRAVEQRAKWHIQTDGMDYPVCGMYKDSLLRMGVKIYHQSRWFNGVTCEMDEKTASKVAGLKFVTNVEMTRDNTVPGNAPKKRIRELEMSESATNKTQEQLATYNLMPLHKAGYEGQGILMAICDGGFYDAQTLSCFRQKDLELGHFDFTDDADDFYGPTGAHGTYCLSTISGILDSSYYGAATKAQYYLMRSEEDATESPKEMDNLVAALEKADSLGVNIFSVSLGYAMFDNDAWSLKKSELDGQTTRVSRAATIAARKGMLVCVAAGNDGNNDWKKISVPADADSVLTVGAVGVDSLIGSFSSWGPSADGRVKPDVCAVGVKTTLIKTDGTISQGNGTSFATPLLAGLAACLWSALPDENAMQIRDRIIRSADRYINPDSYRYGYGIPDAWKAYTMIPTGTENIEFGIQRTDSRKILRHGQLIILREGQMYDVLGRKIE
ncbi:MAG: S8 family serine peptidase [Paludibacteraceae bacterium]|nr:S8 family serine peptidase [Paludibacteraceae bacterium]